MTTLRTTRTALLAASLTSLLPLVAGCIVIDSSHASSTGKQSAAVITNAAAAEGARLDVRSTNGRIEVRRDPTLDKVLVEAEIRCAGETQEEADERVKGAKLVATNGADGTVRVRVDFPPMRSGRDRHPSDGARITVRAARAGAIDLETSNGAIEVTGMGGPLHAETGNGAITVEGHDGPVRLSTSNGAIRAMAVGLPAELDTSNGRIEAEFKAGAKGAVTASTSNGAVQLVLPADWSGTVTARTSNGSVAMEGGPRVTATNVERNSGTMTVGTAAEAAARAEVVTSNGAVRVRVGN
jgi:DUF4097 and DUF4098 domain-containing protein YvlB